MFSYLSFCRLPVPAYYTKNIYIYILCIIYIYIYIYTYTYIYTYIHTYTCVCLLICIHTHTHIYICPYLSPQTLVKRRDFLKTNTLAHMHIHHGKVHLELESSQDNVPRARGHHRLCEGQCLDRVFGTSLAAERGGHHQSRLAGGRLGQGAKERVTKVRKDWLLG